MIFSGISRTKREKNLAAVLYTAKPKLSKTKSKRLMLAGVRKTLVGEQEIWHASESFAIWKIPLSQTQTFKGLKLNFSLKHESGRLCQNCCMHAHLLLRTTYSQLCKKRVIFFSVCMYGTVIKSCHRFMFFSPKMFF